MSRDSPIRPWTLGIIPVTWLAFHIAPALDGGLPAIVQALAQSMAAPFTFIPHEKSIPTIGVLLLFYAVGVGIHLSTGRNFRRREEHGSARWASAKTLAKTYAATPKGQGKILTQNVSLGLDGRVHKRNLNVIVVGGSDAGKTRYFAKPNLMNLASSYVVLDPKGELLRDTGHLMETAGYDVRVIDLINMEKSHCYNPFVYLRSDNDVQRMVTNLMKNTTAKTGGTRT